MSLRTQLRTYRRHHHYWSTPQYILMKSLVLIQVLVLPRTSARHASRELRCTPASKTLNVYPLKRSLHLYPRLAESEVEHPLSPYWEPSHLLLLRISRLASPLSLLIQAPPLNSPLRANQPRPLLLFAPSAGLHVRARPLLPFPLVPKTVNTTHSDRKIWNTITSQPAKISELLRFAPCTLSATNLPFAEKKCGNKSGSLP